MLMGLFAAVTVLLSGVHIPIRPTKVFPLQHKLNGMAGDLIGPWYGALPALIAGIILEIPSGREGFSPSLEGLQEPSS